MKTISKAKPDSMNKLTVIGLLIFALASVGGNVFLGVKYFSAPKVISVLDENQKIIADVGKLMELPTDELPTVAKVDDPQQLIDQGVFTKVQKDDTVLIYPKAKRAILYRPSTNKIIEVATVNITDTPPAATNGSTLGSTPTPTTPPAPAPIPAPAPTPTPTP